MILAQLFSSGDFLWSIVLNVVRVMAVCFAKPPYFLIQQVAVLILHPGWVKTDMGENNAPLPVENDSELNESFDLENSGGFLNFKGRQLPW